MAKPGAIPWIPLILGSVVGLAVAGLIVVLVGPLAVAQIQGGSSYRIRDASMVPALLPGDWVLAEALVPGEVPPRGTLVGYIVPGEYGDEQVRRIVGLPGESIQMRGGALYVNGRRAGMERLEDRILERRHHGRGIPPPKCINDTTARAGACHQEVWRETLPGDGAHLVLNTRHKIGHALPGGSRVRDDTNVYRVPQGSVFVLGDNRDMAIDSRMARHGAVPISSLRYKIWLIHTSVDQSSRFITPRWDRFFRQVN